MMSGHVFDIFRMPVVRYRDYENNPTCAADFETGEVCIFYRTQKYGCYETCVFAEDTGKKAYTKALKRRRDDTGYLIPLDTCPLWKEAK